MTVVYIDQVLVLNTAVDYLLLLCTARLAGAPLRRGRLALCALSGGLYAAAVFLPGWSFLAAWPCKLLAGLALSFLAFYPVRHCWRLMALFFLLSGALAGLLLAIGLAAGSPGLFLSRFYYAEISWSVLLSAAAAMILLLHLLFRQAARHGGGELMHITISLNHQQHELIALHDTGNTLRDRNTGQPVLVAEQGALLSLWPPAVRRILKLSIPPEDKMVQLYHQGAGTQFTLLPFRSVGQRSGLLLAVRSEYIAIGTVKYPRILIALSEHPLSDGGAYCALWGGTEQEGGPYDTLAAASAPVDRPAQQAG